MNVFQESARGYGDMLPVEIQYFCHRPGILNIPAVFQSPRYADGAWDFALPVKMTDNTSHDSTVQATGKQQVYFIPCPADFLCLLNQQLKQSFCNVFRTVPVYTMRRNRFMVNTPLLINARKPGLTFDLMKKRAIARGIIKRNNVKESAH
jgi:hypothetical protein